MFRSINIFLLSFDMQSFYRIARSGRAMTLHLLFLSMILSSFGPLLISWSRDQVKSMKYFMPHELRLLTLIGQEIQAFNGMIDKVLIMVKINMNLKLVFFSIIYIFISSAVFASSSQYNLEVKRFVAMVGAMPNFFEQNIYLLVDVKTKQAAIIDPGNRSHEMEEYISARDITISMILNTHGHYDHVGANDHYSGKYGVNVFVSFLDEELFQEHFTDSSVMKDLNLIESIKFANYKINVLKTPGHTPGSVSLYIGDILFSGDTLFKGSIGRTWGLPETKKRLQIQEISSIREKLLVLPDATRVFPGHGESTSIGYEKSNNRFLIE
ncbi:MAG: MBL fold metallo-hydrolase [Gammaproteobacteria bacterium]|nr:MAG: MBL fold metallo-hydrolase [Gammaproteobacteria bacterium]